jgi:hypothetical protein
MNLKSPPIKKTESNQEPSFEPFDQVGEEIWDIKGVTLFRALGYIVGLPSFMVGTALFMLGFSLTDKIVLNIACILYSLAFIAIVGRPVLLRLNPKNEKQAILIAALSLLSGIFCYELLLALLQIIE